MAVSTLGLVDKGNIGTIALDNPSIIAHSQPNPSHEKRRLHGRILALSFVSESSPRGFMRQQTKSFIVERKPSSKLKPDANKPSIWGKLDLTLQ